MVTDWKPPEFSSITPYFIVHDAEKFIEFLIEGFGGEEILRDLRPDGKVGNAQIKIGNSMVEVGEARPEYPPSISIHLYVPDVDETHSTATRAGATSEYEPTQRFYGDKEAHVKFPDEINWFIATHTEDVSIEEIQNRKETGYQETSKKD